MTTKRIFIAVDISEHARNACVAHVEHLRKQFPNVRVGWERPEKLHITLKFLGSTHVDTLERLTSEIGATARSVKPFELALSAPGVFRSRGKPRILWIGTEDRESVLATLAASVEEVCGVLGYEGELRQFSPHLTIGRIREPQSASALAKLHTELEIEPVRFKVDNVVIYESKPEAAGSRYEPIVRVQLGQRVK